MMTKRIATFVVPFVLILGATGCSRYFYYPTHDLYFPPAQLGLNAQDLSFKSADGTQLTGWFIPATTKAKGTIIQFHGNGENMTSHYTKLAWLTRHGYNLFTWDYRGYGRSRGTPSQDGIARDATAALDQAWALHAKRGGGTFVVFGQSLGGAIALRALWNFRHRDEVALTVMDSTFTSYKDEAQQLLARRWYSWPVSWMPRLLVSDRYAADAVVPRLRTPLLVIHDLRDPVVAFQNGEKIFESANCPKELWVLDHGDHVGVFFPDSFENRERFVELLASLEERASIIGKRPRRNREARGIAGHALGDP